MSKIKSVPPVTTLVQPIVKKQNITVTLKDENLVEDVGNWVKQEHVYLDIKGYQLSGPYLVVQLHDDTQHVYPMDGVFKLTLTVTQE